MGEAASRAEVEQHRDAAVTATRLAVRETLGPCMGVLSCSQYRALLQNLQMESDDVWGENAILLIREVEGTYGTLLDRDSDSLRAGR